LAQLLSPLSSFLPVICRDLYIHQGSCPGNHKNQDWRRVINTCGGASNNPRESSATSTRTHPHAISTRTHPHAKRTLGLSQHIVDGGAMPPSMHGLVLSPIADCPGLRRPIVAILGSFPRVPLRARQRGKSRERRAVLVVGHCLDDGVDGAVPTRRGALHVDCDRGVKRREARPPDAVGVHAIVRRVYGWCAIYSQALLPPYAGGYP
jgi:hypothetical protein